MAYSAPGSALQRMNVMNGSDLVQTTPPSSGSLTRLVHSFERLPIASRMSWEDGSPILNRQLSWGARQADGQGIRMTRQRIQQAIQLPATAPLGSRTVLIPATESRGWKRKKGEGMPHAISRPPVQPVNAMSPDPTAAPRYLARRELARDPFSASRPTLAVDSQQASNRNNPSVHATPFDLSATLPQVNSSFFQPSKQLYWSGPVSSESSSLRSGSAISSSVGSRTTSVRGFSQVHKYSDPVMRQSPLIPGAGPSPCPSPFAEVLRGAHNVPVATSAPSFTVNPGFRVPEDVRNRNPIANRSVVHGEQYDDASRLPPQRWHFCERQHRKPDNPPSLLETQQRPCHQSVNSSPVQVEEPNENHSDPKAQKKDVTRGRGTSKQPRRKNVPTRNTKLRSRTQPAEGKFEKVSNLDDSVQDLHILDFKIIQKNISVEEVQNLAACPDGAAGNDLTEARKQLNEDNIVDLQGFDFTNQADNLLWPVPRAQLDSRDPSSSAKKTVSPINTLNVITSVPSFCDTDISTTMGCAPLYTLESSRLPSNSSRRRQFSDWPDSGSVYSPATSFSPPETHRGQTFRLTVTHDNNNYSCAGDRYASTEECSTRPVGSNSIVPKLILPTNLSRQGFSWGLGTTVSPLLTPVTTTYRRYRLSGGEYTPSNTARALGGLNTPTGIAVWDEQYRIKDNFKPEMSPAEAGGKQGDISIQDMNSRLVAADRLVKDLKQKGIKLIAFDFDGTLTKRHIIGWPAQDVVKNAQAVCAKDAFALAQTCLHQGLQISIVTFNDPVVHKGPGGVSGAEMIKLFIESVKATLQFDPGLIVDFYPNAYVESRGGTLAHRLSETASFKQINKAQNLVDVFFTPSDEDQLAHKKWSHGKNLHLNLLSLFKGLKPWEILLVDDDMLNISLAQEAKFSTLAATPGPGFQFNGVVPTYAAPS